MTENNITPSFVPCGIPSFGHFQPDSTPVIQTACILLERKADTQFVRAECILSWRFPMSTLWSMRSKPLEKSVEKIKNMKKTKIAQIF